ncbi:hypothetical protein G7043_01810 [Lentzea sp. NEAU-D13]|uniref:Uncharacterized protein n=1 Tax=Lentzea alba TaxID=2714351 RepID=A0A7C9RQ26_9PSEU|nr:hypothetical protein [Lentzea alba]NGY57662.1 hypothetical protein [Lentzea alba]
MSKFENNLWTQLERDHAPALLQSVATQRRLRTRRWVGAAASVVVVGATAVIAPVYFGGTPPAYAVVDNPDGSVTLTVREVQRFQEATGKLRERGITAIAVPLRRDCAQRESTLQEPLDAVEFDLKPGAFNIKISPGNIPANATVVLATDESRGESWIIAGGVYPSDQLPACLLDRGR